MTKGWIYRSSGVFALTLALNNFVMAAEWAIYQDGFQVPPLLGSDSAATVSTTASQLNPRSLVMGDGDDTQAGDKVSNDRQQTAEFGIYYGELTEYPASQAMEHNPRASASDELLGPAGVFVRVRF